MSSLAVIPQDLLLLGSVLEIRNSMPYLPCWSSIRFTTWIPPLSLSPLAKPSTRPLSASMREREFLRGLKRSTSELSSTSPETTTKTFRFERAIFSEYWRSRRSSGGTLRILKAVSAWSLCPTWRSTGRPRQHQGPLGGLSEDPALTATLTATALSLHLCLVNRASMPSPHPYPIYRMVRFMPGRFRREFPMPMIKLLLLWRYKNVLFLIYNIVLNRHTDYLFCMLKTSAFILHFEKYIFLFWRLPVEL